jgi:charged multivesicular body protein 6
MSNQDEDEVEDELEALAAEVSGVQQLPNAPTNQLGLDEQARIRQQKERARRRERERAYEQAAEPMLT